MIAIIICKKKKKHKKTYAHTLNKNDKICLLRTHKLYIYLYDICKYTLRKHVVQMKTLNYITQRYICHI